MQPQTKPKIILFDIDYTLIDTDKLRKLTNEKILKIVKISLQKLEKATEEFANTLKTSKEFSPQKYAQFLAKYFADAAIRKAVNNIFREPGIYQQATYPEVISVFKKLKQIFRLGIYSEGVKEFQMNKLTLSGIIKYLDKNLIFIYPDKTGKAEELVKKFGEVYFVDDNPKHIKDITKTEGAHPIWLKRGPKAQACGSLNCPTILSLEELGTIL